MEKIRLLERKEIIGGFAMAKNDSINLKKIAKKSKPFYSKIEKFASNPFLHRYSAVMLTIIPGLFSLGETISSLMYKERGTGCRWLCPHSGWRSRAGGYSGSWYSRNDYFIRAAEAFKPTIKLSPYPSRTSMNIGMPWMG